MGLCALSEPRRSGFSCVRCCIASCLLWWPLWLRRCALSAEEQPEALARPGAGALWRSVAHRCAWPLTWPHTPARWAPVRRAGPAALAFSSSSVEHLHVIWERVTCGSHQAEERLNQGLITVCLEGSGPK